MTHTTTIQQWGNSLAIRIPKKLALDAQFRKKDALVIGHKNGVLTIKSARTNARHHIRIKPKYSIAELVDGITPENINIDREWIDMKPVGREIL